MRLAAHMPVRGLQISAWQPSIIELWIKQLLKAKTLKLFGVQYTKPWV